MINSSSSSSSQKPIPVSSLKRLSAGTSNGLKAEAGGKIKPIQAKKLTVSSHNLASNGITLPPRTRSGRTVHLPGRYRLIISQGFQMNELIIFLICTYVNVFVEGQKLRLKENHTGKTCRFLSVNMVEPCFVYMKEAISTSVYSTLPESKVTKGTPLN